jgi:NADPH:quinone reductase-like Zn-dependent oxidoreductase
MRAVRYARFGGPEVLEVVDIEAPVPAAGEVKVAVRAASLNPLDWKIRAGHLRFIPTFARPPRTTGVDLAGEIVAIGGGPGPRHVGERVFGSLSPFGREGSCAEFAIVPAQRLAPTPAEVSDEDAACLPVAAGTAVQALASDVPLRPGQRVLIMGAAGGVGHFAVQFAKHLDLVVVATCGPSNVEFVRSLGADRVVDYTRDDPTRLGERFDLVFDVANALDPVRARPLLVRGGTYLGTAGTTAAAIATGVAGLLAPLAGTRARSLVLKGGAAHWQRLAELARQRVLKPHILRRVGLDGVAEAQGAMASGHGRGKIVVVPSHGS